MKRLNPQTNEPFKYKDKREDGYIFRGYSKKINPDGYFRENWISPDAHKKEKKSNVSRKFERICTKDGHIEVQFYNIKHRAKSKNIEFDLTLAYLKSLAPNTCPVLDIPLAWGARQGHTRKNSPSLDRIDPKKGYTIGNVQWVSHIANSMKSDATPEQLKKFADWVIKNV